MPRAWSAKDERMYEHIVRSCMKKELRDHFNNRVKRRRSPKSSLKSCKRIAAATVNSLRRRQGRTLDGLGLPDFEHRTEAIRMMDKALSEIRSLKNETTCGLALEGILLARDYLSAMQTHIKSIEDQNERQVELDRTKDVLGKFNAAKGDFFASSCFDQNLLNHGHFYGLKKQLKLPQTR